MSEGETTLDILLEAYDDGCERCARDLRAFTEPLYAWCDQLVQPRLPADWRGKLDVYLAEQVFNGYRVLHEHLPPLLEWIQTLEEYHSRQRDARHRELAAKDSERWGPTILLELPPGSPTREQLAAARARDALARQRRYELYEERNRQVLEAGRAAGKARSSPSQSFVTETEPVDPTSASTHVTYAGAGITPAGEEESPPNRTIIIPLPAGYRTEEQIAIAKAWEELQRLRYRRIYEERTRQVREVIQIMGEADRDPSDVPAKATDPNGLLEIHYEPDRVALKAAQFSSLTTPTARLFSEFDAAWTVDKGGFSAIVNGKKCQLSDEIAIIQIVKGALDQGGIPHPLVALLNNYDWTIDGNPFYRHASKTLGGVVRGDPATVGVISMEDFPHLAYKTVPYWGSKIESFNQYFETYVVSVSGREGIKRRTQVHPPAKIITQNITEITVYAGVTWHHSFTRRSDGSYDAERIITSRNAAPSRNLESALRKYYSKMY